MMRQGEGSKRTAGKVRRSGIKPFLEVLPNSMAERERQKEKDG